MAYYLGIDIGIASIGFAGVDKESKRKLFAHAYIFDDAEVPKTGASLAQPRCKARV